MKPIIFSSPIKINYKPLQNSKIFWPILDLEISYQSNVIPRGVKSLIDSGASVSILHPQIASHLGFDLNKLGASRPGGVSVSGNYQSWTLPDPVNVNIFGYDFSFSFTVIDSPNQIWGCILGEDSIFSVAKIEFQKFKGFFELRFRQDLN